MYAHVVHVMDALKQEQACVRACGELMTMQVVEIEYLGIVTNFVRLNAVQWGSCCIVAALSMGWDLP